MKTALHKSSIPPSKIFVIRFLEEKHFDPVWHAHSEYQLFVVLEGTGTRFIGDSIKAYKPGELVFTGPNLPHLWRSDEIYFEKKSALESKGIVIYLNENFLGDNIIEKEEMMLIKRLFTRSMQGLEFFGAKKEEAIQLMKELVHLNGIEGVIHLLRILQTLAGCKEHHTLSTKTYDHTFKNETDRLNKVYEYVLKNFRKKIELNELAALLYMTPTSFSRYFAMKNNKPISKFIAEIRIKHACKLLTETEDSVAQICYECGFNTLSNFNKQFKEIMRKNPMEYKKQILSI
ncbi:MAG: AraC family transcriptional regulator [Bacteroidota bacterium]|nr:AraC family transcriptional regulator [Bacteroidota bacterium]